MPSKRGYNESQKRLFDKYDRDRNSRQGSLSGPSANAPPDDFEIVLRSRSEATSPTPRTPASGQGSATSPSVTVSHENNLERIVDTDDEAASASDEGHPKKKARRGPVSLKRTAELVTNTPNHTPFLIGWDAENGRHTTDDNRGKQSFIMALGSIIRSEIPLTQAKLPDHGIEAYEKIHDRLSPFYRIDRTSRPLLKYISDKCNKLYSRYKGKYKVLYEKSGGKVPKQFIHRRDEWDFLCKHFESEEFKALSSTMSSRRKSEKKLNHRSGPTPFIDRAMKRKAEIQCSAPHLETYIQVHEKNAPEVTAKLKSAMETQIANIKASQPSVTEGTVDTTQSAICLPKEIEITVFEDILGPSNGTVVHGMGGVQVRDGKTRGPTKGSIRGPVVDEGAQEEIKLLKELVERERAERKNQEALNEEKYNKLYAMMLQMQQNNGGRSEGSGGSH